MRASQNTLLCYPLIFTVSMPAVYIFTIKQFDRRTPNRYFRPDQYRGANTGKVIGYPISENHSAFDLISAYLKFKIHIPGPFFPLRGDGKAVFTIVRFNFRNWAGASKSIYKTSDQGM